MKGDRSFRKEINHESSAIRTRAARPLFPGHGRGDLSAASRVGPGNDPASFDPRCRDAQGALRAGTGRAAPRIRLGNCQVGPASRAGPEAPLAATDVSGPARSLAYGLFDFSFADSRMLG